MKIVILKFGDYGFHPSGTPMTELEESDVGEIMDFEKSQARMLMDDKWAREPTEEELEEIEVEVEDPEENEDGDSDPDPDKDTEDEEEIEDVEAHLTKLIEGKDEEDAKQLLQDWGKTRLDITVSKSNKIENMIAKLVESV